MQLVSKLARCTIADDTWQSGDTILLSTIKISLGEDRASSTCEFSVLDVDFKIGAKYRSISVAAGGILVPAELLQTPSGAKPQGTTATTSSKTGLSNFSGGDRDATVRAIIAECQKQGVTDPAQIAYVLGTVQHECGFKPIPEIGGTSTRYAPYYGRGYVQLTWRENYQKYQDLTGQPLVSNPDLALRPDIASFILVHGMRTGNFTGRKLADYGSGNSFDFVGARAIVNGTDRASLIAGYSQQWLEKLPQYLSGFPMTPQPATPSASTPQTVPAKVETGSKGTEIIIELGVGWGLTFKNCINFHFIHTGTISELATDSSPTTTFSGKSVRWLLTRVPVTQSFENVTFRQYLEDRCKQFGLTLEMEGDGLTYTHLSQDGQTHLDLILREARRIGFSVKEGVGADSGKLIVEPSARPKFTGFVIDEEVLVKPARFTDEARSSTATTPLGTVSSPGTGTGEIKTAIDRATGDMTQPLPESMAGTGNAPTGTGMATGATAPPVGGTVAAAPSSGMGGSTQSTPLSEAEQTSIANTEKKEPQVVTRRSDGSQVITDITRKQSVESERIVRTVTTQTVTVPPGGSPVGQTIEEETVITDDGRTITTTTFRPGFDDVVETRTEDLTAEDKRLMELSKRSSSSSTTASPGAGLPNQPAGVIDLLDGKAEATLLADESKRVKGYEDSFTLTMNMDTLQLVPGEIIGISGRLFPQAFATEKRIYSVEHDFAAGTTRVLLYVPQAPPPEASQTGSATSSTPGVSSSVPATNPGGFILPCSGSTGDGIGSRGGGRMHKGLDIAAAGGTPLVAPADGVVTDVVTGCGVGDHGCGGGYGNLVDIQHANGLYTRCAHLSAVSVAVGQQVKQGQNIGTVGDTGHSFGPHLHFEVRRGEPYGEVLAPSDVGITVPQPHRAGFRY